MFSSEKKFLKNTLMTKTVVGVDLTFLRHLVVVRSEAAV